MLQSQPRTAKKKKADGDGHGEVKGTIEKTEAGEKRAKKRNEGKRKKKDKKA
jgi:hypothetical protein